MAGRIILFGATGYTGQLTARALVARGAAPVLAARSEGRVAALAAELGGLEHRVADVADPVSVRGLVDRGDVLISTVGPFARWGAPAVEAAIAAGAVYLDSTGEPPFIRRVFEQWGPRAAETGATLVTAFGFDWVPGNLAGALALQEAGAEAVQVHIGYFADGSVNADGMSGGTRASLAGVLFEPGYGFHDGALHTERGGARRRSFTVDGRERPALAAGASEQFGLPPLFPRLRDVEVYLGWFGPLSPAVQAFSAGTALVTKVPGVHGALTSAAARLVPGSTGGPSAEQRAGSGSHVIAVAADAAGTPLATVAVRGVNAYDFTAGILAWGATAALDGVDATGAQGPVGAFGLERLRDGAAQAGIAVV